jgi:hypothetical protein
LVFVSLGYWEYLKYPVVFGLRPSAPIGRGITAFSLILGLDFIRRRYEGKWYVVPLLTLFYAFSAIPLLYPDEVH